MYVETCTVAKYIGARTTEWDMLGRFCNWNVNDVIPTAYRSTDHSLSAVNVYMKEKGLVMVRAT